MRFTNRSFGVEIEISDCDVTEGRLANLITLNGVQCNFESYNHNTRRHWKIVSDSSLRGRRTMEIVSPPLSGAEGAEALRTVCKVLNENNAKVNRSCGMHVHHDASDFNRSGLRNVQMFYAKFEKVIDWFMPRSRRNRGNDYCGTMVRDNDVEDTVRWIETQTNNNHGTYHGRYYKLNMSAYMRHGTIEFRQHGGTVEYRKIIAWVVFTQAIVEYARTKKVRATGQVTLAKLFNTLGWYNKAERDTITEKSVRFLSKRFNHFVEEAGATITNKTDLR